jgi:hypothetical protein
LRISCEIVEKFTKLHLRMGRTINTKVKKTPPEELTSKPRSKLPLKLVSVQKFTLAKPSNPKCSPGKVQEQHSELKMFLVPIGSSKGYGLYFKREGNPPWASWADKLMFDMLRKPDGVEWMENINMFNTTYELHEQNVPIINKRHWGVRVYVGFVGQDLTNDLLLQIGKCVAENVNQTGELRENQKVTVDPETFLENMDASWYDFVGQEGAKKLAHKLIKEDDDELAHHFAANLEDFHSFWKSGQITLEVARSIHLPTSMSKEIYDADME